MNSVNRIIKLAERFAHKLAQQSDPIATDDKPKQSAQPSEIAKVLAAAGLMDTVDNMGNVLKKSAATDKANQLLAQSGIPDNVSVLVNIVVDTSLNCSYVVETTPPFPAGAIKYRALLAKEFSGKMKSALTAAKIWIDDAKTLTWLKF